MRNRALFHADMELVLGLIPVEILCRTADALKAGDVRPGSYRGCLMHQFSGGKVVDKPGFDTWVRGLAEANDLRFEDLHLACRRMVRGFDEAEETFPVLNPGDTLEAYQAHYPLEYLLTRSGARRAIMDQLQRRVAG